MIKPERLSYEDVRRRADDFLKEHNPADIIPVDIDSIAEFGLGIMIVPEFELEYFLSLDSYLSGNLKEIYIDKKIFHYQAPRSRFSIAHEIGHLVMHRKLYETSGVKTREDFLRFHDAIDPNDLNWFESQAKWFAGLVLVPKHHLEMIFKQAKKRFINAGMDLENIDSDDFIESASNWICRRFNVNSQVIQIRINKDNLKI